MAQHVPPVPAQLACDSPTAREEATTFLQKGLKLVTGMDAQFSPTGLLTGQGQVDLVADDHQGRALAPVFSVLPRKVETHPDGWYPMCRAEQSLPYAYSRVWPVTLRAPLTCQQRAQHGYVAPARVSIARVGLSLSYQTPDAFTAARPVKVRVCTRVWNQRRGWTQTMLYSSEHPQGLYLDPKNLFGKRAREQEAPTAEDAAPADDAPAPPVVPDVPLEPVVPDVPVVPVVPVAPAVPVVAAAGATTVHIMGGRQTLYAPTPRRPRSVIGSALREAGLLPREGPTGVRRRAASRWGPAISVPVRTAAADPSGGAGTFLLLQAVVVSQSHGFQIVERI